MKRFVWCLMSVAAAACAHAAAEGAPKAAPRNLVANPSFEDDAVAFAWGRKESPVREAAADDSRYASRPDSRHVRTGRRAWLFRSANAEGGNTMTFAGLPIAPGRRYAFTAHYYLDDGEGPATVWGNRHEHDAAGKTSGYRNLEQFDTRPGRWNVFSCTFYAAPDSATADVELIFGGRMSVWVDDVSFVEEAPPAPVPPVGAVLPGTEALSLAYLAPFTKATPAGVPPGLAPGDGAVHLDAAKNERESFQLVLGAKRDLRDVTVELTDFAAGDARIGRGAATVREVRFVPVAGVDDPRMNRLHPDPVVPFSSADVPAGSNLVLLVTVKTPRAAVPGVYTATATVRAGGAAVASVPVRLRVRGFALPETARLKSYFYFAPGAFGNSYGRFDARSEQAIRDDFHRHYRALRLSGNQAASIPAPKWELRGDRVVVTDWSPYDDEVARLREAYGFSVFPVPFVGMLGDNAGWFPGGRGVTNAPSGRVVGTAPRATPFGGFFDEPEGRQRVVAALRQFADHARARFPGALFCWYFYDEPPHAVMDVLPALLKTYVDALPEIRFLVVHTPAADRLERYDVRVASFSAATVSPQVRNFGTTWYYQYPAVITDEAYLRGRFFPWQVYAADGEGVLLWDVAFYGNPSRPRRWVKAGDPWQNPCVAYADAHTTLFYPPRPGTDEGAVPSIRAVNVGDAIDDFDYLKLYEEKVGREAVRKMLARVLPEATDTPADPRAFLQLRAQMAAALEPAFTVVAVGPDPAPTNRIVRRVDPAPIVVPRFADDLRALGTGGLTPVDGHSGSFAFLAVVEPKTRRGVVAGWLTNEKASGVIQSGFDAAGNVVIRPFAEYGRMEVPAGAAVEKDLFVYGFFDDCRRGLEQYADLVAAHYGISLPRQIAGYTTWYDDVHGYSHREGAGTAASAKAFADAAVRHNLGAYGFDFYQIDDFWQAGRTDINGPARDFFHVNPKGPFPDGFRETTAYFAARGFVPGLWTMPFGGLSREPFFADKQDIFATAAETTPGARGHAASDAVGLALAQTAGRPFETAWGGTIVDLTKPSGLKYVADLARLITVDWGFRYIKFDGMWTGHGGDLLGGATWRNDHYDNIVRADGTKTGVEAFRLGVKAMRGAAAPGTFLLACNSAQNPRSIAASYGLVDGMRIGGDNGPIDEFPDRYLKGPIAATPRYFYNGRVWYNDPDPIYVRDAVPLNRARLFASWGGVSGLLYNFSDYLPNLSDARVELLKRTMAPHGIRACRPVDYFENLTSHVWEVGEGDSRVFGLFNWKTNAALAVDYPAAYCGLDPAKDYVAFDFWRDELIPPFAGRFAFEVPADDCRVLAVHACTGRPFVLSTSRHVASPLFDVKEERWDAATRTLSGVSQVVPGERYELRIYADGKLVRRAFTPDRARFAWRVALDAE